MVSDKPAIRESILKTRRSLSADDIQSRTQRVFKLFLSHLSELLPHGDVSKVAMYFPIRGEVDTRPFFEHYRAQGAHCLFPKVGEHGLDFFEARDWSDLKPGKFKIPEPTETRALTPELVLVPGVAYTPDCYRVGYGAGHYDRTVATWLAAGERKSLRMVGLAYDFQVVPGFAKENYDLPLDAVVTESKVFGI